MESTNLSLDRELKIISGKEYTGVIKVRELIYELAKQFPNGFYPESATGFMRVKMGGVPEQVGPFPNIYQSLVANGFLEYEVQKLPTGKQHKHFYKFNPAVIRGEIPLKHEFSVSIPNGLDELLYNYQYTIGVPKEQINILVTKLLQIHL